VSGQFGYGWRSNYDVTLFQEVDQTVTEINAEGTHTIYSRDTYGDYHPFTREILETDKERRLDLHLDG